MILSSTISQEIIDNLLTLHLPSNNSVILATSPGLQLFPKNW